MPGLQEGRRGGTKERSCDHISPSVNIRHDSPCQVTSHIIIRLMVCLAIMFLHGVVAAGGRAASHQASPGVMAEVYLLPVPHRDMWWLLLLIFTSCSLIIAGIYRHTSLYHIGYYPTHSLSHHKFLMGAGAWRSDEL